jgi:hypothetical protein
VRSSKSLFALTIAAGLALFAAGADAAGKKDKDVQKLLTQAMDEDYLNVEFDKAEGKLKKAVETCTKEKDACSPELLGKVHIGLATVHGVGQQKLDVAKADLVAALKADPKAALLEGLTTPELEAKFKEAQAEVGGGGTGGGGTAGGGTGGDTAAPVASDFPHTPVAEQAVNTPVPVFAEVGDDMGAAKVIARYKPYGGTKWETLVLEKMEGGFGGVVPCDAVTSTGELRYFIIASDEGGTPIATAGSMKAPFKVTIKNKITGDKPSLPGKEPPKKCSVVEDCPPGLPGCKGDGSGKPVDAICDATPECAKGLICASGVCTPGEGNDGPDTGGTTDGTQHLLSVGVQVDIAYVSSGENVCSGESSASYVCMLPDTDPSTQFFGVPAGLNGTNAINGGLAYGGTRVFVGYDYFFKFGLGLGARVGYAIGGPYPCTPGEEGCPAIPDGSGTPAANSFFPAHLEARASWKFLNPNPKGGDFAPHVFIGGGGAQVNSSVPVTVCDQLLGENEEASESCAEGGPAVERRVDAYQLAGLTFVTFGGGVSYMFHRHFGISGELKFMVLFPTVGFTISPTIAPVVAF